MIKLLEWTEDNTDFEIMRQFTEINLGPKKNVENLEQMIQYDLNKYLGD